jgi:hypothetical protein
MDIDKKWVGAAMEGFMVPDIEEFTPPDLMESALAYAAPLIRNSTLDETIKLLVDFKMFYPQNENMIDDIIEHLVALQHKVKRDSDE